MQREENIPKLKPTSYISPLQQVSKPLIKGLGSLSSYMGGETEARRGGLGQVTPLNVEEKDHSQGTKAFWSSKRPAG